MACCPNHLLIELGVSRRKEGREIMEFRVVDDGPHFTVLRGQRLIAIFYDRSDADAYISWRNSQS